MNYHNITTRDMKNGDGLRVVLWLAGCSHHCKGCQNPQTWNPESGILFDNSAREEIFAELKEEYCSGITLSGGDPLYEGNRLEVLNLCKQIIAEYPNKTIWLYTGYTLAQIKELFPQILPYIDVLVDGRYEEDKRDIEIAWRGSTNQIVHYLKEGRCE